MRRKGKKNKKESLAELPQGKYSFISLQLRTTLIDMVTHQGFSVYRASKDLCINNSTAKVILRNFRKRGHIYCRKSERFGEGHEVESEGESNQQQQINSRPPQKQENVSDEQVQPAEAPLVHFEPNYALCLCYPVCHLMPFYAPFQV